MNNGPENEANPSLNGRPYYSADNGFACAAAGRGVTEALQEHLNVIVRNEELEIERTHSQIQAEIEALVEGKDRLEKQKLDRQDKITTLTEEHDGKEVKISELTTQLEAPIQNDKPPPDPRIDSLNTAIEEKTLALEEKQVARVKIETDLEAPTEAELKPPAAEQTPVSRFSRLDKVFAGFTLLALLGLVFYLFIFYASAGDRAFTEGVGTVEQKKNIIIPSAIRKAWEGTSDDDSPTDDRHKNWFVLMFPVPFLVLAFIFYWFEVHSNRKYKWDLWLIILATFIIDFIIAVKISQQMHYFKTGVMLGLWDLFKTNWIEILSVLFLGFGVSVLLGVALSWVMKVGNGGKQPQGETELLETLKRAEQNDRLVQLAAVTEEIQHLQNRIDDLKQQRENCERGIEETSKQQLNELIQAHRHPIQIDIARLNAEKEPLQNQINELHEQVESIQKEINQCEAEIEDLSNNQRKTVIDVKKLEAQAYEFVSGWWRYVAHSHTELPADAVTRLQDIHNLVDETLETYKKSLLPAQGRSQL